MSAVGVCQHQPHASMRRGATAAHVPATSATDSPLMAGAVKVVFYVPRSGICFWNSRFQIRDIVRCSHSLNDNYASYFMQMWMSARKICMPAQIPVQTLKAPTFAHVLWDSLLVKMDEHVTVIKLILHSSKQFMHMI